jgi:acetate CoA/acetoacetate CoA-transferase beta subunit
MKDFSRSGTQESTTAVSPEPARPPSSPSAPAPVSVRHDDRCIIAARAALELEDGEVTNLGAGIPMLVANYIPESIQVFIQAENGILGVGPVSRPGTEDPDRRNAGNLFVTLLPGGCYFDTATSFAMIRGGRVAATMLGTLQVDGEGNIANYEMPGRKIGMGGAMDLVAGARRVYVLTEHCTKEGAPKLVRLCTLPLTGAEECDVIITERAVFRRHPEHGFLLEEVARGHTLEEVAACTELAFEVADDVKLDACGG